MEKAMQLTNKVLGIFKHQNSSMKTPVSTRTAWKNPIHFIAFGFGSGTIPFAPGTMGTLMAIPLYLLIRDFPLAIYIAILIAATILGIWACDVTEKYLGTHDYKGIVWDEVCGYWLTMLAAPHHWEWVVLGFFLFRLFDIWKPWPIGWIDKYVRGGLGVMVDDLMAGVYGLVVLQGLVWLLTKF